MSIFVEYVNRNQGKLGRSLDLSDIAEQFKDAYESGERIEVATGYGEIKRGTVGLTTGSRPSFLLMHNKRCIGSSTLLSKSDRLLRCIRR